MVRRRCVLLGMGIVLFGLAGPHVSWADEIDDHVQAIAKAGPMGAGSAEAAAARDALAGRGVAVLPRLLEAMDTPNIVAANWYRSAYEEIIAQALSQDDPMLPLKLLESFLADGKRQGRARRLVRQLVERLDPAYFQTLLPTLLHDNEFYREAINEALKAGDAAKTAGDAEAAKAEYRKAFGHARDSDQVVQAAARLKAAGEEAKVTDQLGLLTRWYLLGPFDAPQMTGFGHEFLPDLKVDLNARFVGKQDEIGWKLYETPDQLGQTNLIQAIGSVEEAAGYAWCEVQSPIAGPVQLRCGADDNITVWLNGEKIFTRRQWLNGTRFDRFVAPAMLRKGKNEVLLKICQGPHHANPAVPNNWSFQIRFCTPQGRGVGLTTLLPEPSEGSKP